MTRIPLLSPSQDGSRYTLTSPTALPKAGGFLWNPSMMIHTTARGYATAQFMQPEPAKYSHAPNIEAKTFMQPEQAYYAHHPGRFCYVKDEDSGLLWSAPYEPVRGGLDGFEFTVGKSDITWTAEKDGIRVVMRLTLPARDVVELWSVSVTNLSSRPRRLSIYPYFVIGYMSWMNQGAEYRADLGGIVGSCITPYQKAEDYWKSIRHLKDKTFFLCEDVPDAWEANLAQFEGEGGLHSPDGIVKGDVLAGGDARYETPAAVVQYRLALEGGGEKDTARNGAVNGNGHVNGGSTNGVNAGSTAAGSGSTRELRFLFGPAFDDAEITSIREKYLSASSFTTASAAYASYIAAGRGVLTMTSPDPCLDNFVNHWLPRQVYYHGDVNRLSTDPQTRNYLQDNMGMSWIKPSVARSAVLLALSQQRDNGAMPDGIIIAEGAELKYINQVPHTDHCVWVPVMIEAYLAETGDFGVLEEIVESRDPTTGKKGGERRSVFERVGRAMDWLLSEEARDPRGLSYIAQGDWCDPMNMAGIKGVGVSGWLTVATAYALRLWAEIVEQHTESVQSEAERREVVRHFRNGADEVNQAANQHFWDGEWFARGITDDGVTFGVKDDPEGRIWLNPQAWAILGGAAAAAAAAGSAPSTSSAANGTATKQNKIALMIRNVEEQLETPHGVAMFGPPFTKMREDVGRVTQKFPGNGENASIYNHAAIFYIHALYDLAAGTAPGLAADAGDSVESRRERQRHADRAYRLLRKMLPGPDEADYLQRGQMPVYTPNYYRGAWREFPRTAGVSSQLFNTGTVSWQYRSFIEGLCGLRGFKDGLMFRPNLPSWWDGVDVVREFRGAVFDVRIRRQDGVDGVRVVMRQSGEELEGARFTGRIEEGARHEVDVFVALAV